MKRNTVLGGGLVAALLSSLCCITPVLALVAGTSSLGASLSWLEPLRPYLVGVTIGVLGFAWYQKLFPKMDAQDCACETKPKRSFVHTKLFLTILTFSALVIISFPHYAHVFYPTAEKTIIVDSSDIRTAEFRISGMTCQGCAEHVKYEANLLPGVLKVEASYESGNALVEFDGSLVSIDEIEEAINRTGYKVVDLIYD
ncbi:MAG: mercuric transport protein MerTP [Cyclobacteriaceae bacterium]